MTQTKNAPWAYVALALVSGGLIYEHGRLVTLEHSVAENRAEIRKYRQPLSITVNPVITNPVIVDTDARNPLTGWPGAAKGKGGPVDFKKLMKEVGE